MVTKMKIREFTFLQAMKLYAKCYKLMVVYEKDYKKILKEMTRANNLTAVCMNSGNSKIRFIGSKIMGITLGAIISRLDVYQEAIEELNLRKGTQ